MKVNDFFRQENAINIILTKLADLLLLNLLWIVACIPIITIGASTTALYTMTMKMVKDEETGIIKGFFTAFKENFKQSVPITLLMFVVAAVIFIDLHVLGSSTQGFASVMYGGCIVLAVLAISVLIYTFPVLAKFDNTVKNTISNAAKMAVTHLGTTVIVVLINCVPIGCFLVFPNIFARVWVIWLVIGFSLAAFLNSIFLLKVFGEFIEEKEEYVAEIDKISEDD